MRRVLAFDPATGSMQYVDYDENTDTFRVCDEIEAQPLIDLNKKFYNEAPTRWRDGQVVGRVPMQLWQTLKSQGIIDDDKALRRWLNDSDNAGFRTRPGRV